MTTKTQTKTIDVNCMEWFDKVNGNSYFAGRVTVNYGMDDEFIFYLPFQYGYDNQYQHEAATQLNKRGYLPNYDGYTALTRYCRENGIIYRGQLVDKCKKRDLMNITKFIEQEEKNAKNPQNISK